MVQAISILESDVESAAFVGSTFHSDGCTVIFQLHFGHVQAVALGILVGVKCSVRFEQNLSILFEVEPDTVIRHGQSQEVLIFFDSNLYSGRAARHRIFQRIAQ